MEPVQPQANFFGKAKEYWQKIVNSENFPNELGISLIVLLVLIGVVVIFLFHQNNLKAINQKLFTAPTPTPTPIPLPRGPREFSAQGGSNPQIRDFKFSEYNPRVGESQTITVLILDEERNVESVEVTLITDNKTKTYPLQLTGGTVKRGDWSATITADDTRDYVYRMIIKAKNNKGQTAKSEPIFR